METIKFKTNIKCAGCIATATPYLNKALGEDNWQVDVQSPQKILTVKTNSEATEEVIIAAVKEAGYTAECLG